MPHPCLAFGLLKPMEFNLILPGFLIDMLLTYALPRPRPVTS